ncbi:MAG: hydrogenase maturation nickel metallochaperone HypA [Candidatus Dormibacteraeota bacterium]|nr:hydrogenase maturation nickel metallochaperone HypA [Candidatus Dormibacteraeota bacterium]
MHELALCEAVLATALDVSGGRPVQRLRVRVGQLQGVLPESWGMCWQMVSMNGPAAGSTVDLDEVPARVVCRACGAETTPPSAPFACRACAATTVEVVQGEELLLEEVEVEGGEVLRNPRLPVEEVSR